MAQKVEVEHARTSRVVDMGQKPFQSICDTDPILNCFATFHRQGKLQGNFALGIQEVRGIRCSLSLWLLVSGLVKADASEQVNTARTQSTIWPVLFPFP